MLLLPSVHREKNKEKKPGESQEVLGKIWNLRQNYEGMSIPSDPIQKSDGKGVQQVVGVSGHTQGQVEKEIITVSG